MRVFKIFPFNYHFETLVRDEAYQEYKLLRAGKISPEVASYRPLSSRNQDKEPFNLLAEDGRRWRPLLPVDDVLAVDEAGRGILEQFGPGQFTYWPLRLYDSDGSLIDADYWVTDASQVATVEYISDQRKVWWGDKVGGFTLHNAGWYWSTKPHRDGDLLKPVLDDWRPHVRTKETFFPEKISGPEAEGLWFWKSFIYETERYLCSGDFRDAFPEKVPDFSFVECQVVKNRWVAEKQMLPLLEWIEEKAERKLEWVRRYPTWVLRHRPDWFAQTGE